MFKSKKNNKHEINYTPIILLSNFGESSYILMVYAGIMTLCFTIFLLSTVYEEAGKHI